MTSDIGGVEAFWGCWEWRKHFAFGKDLRLGGPEGGTFRAERSSAEASTPVAAVRRRGLEGSSRGRGRSPRETPTQQDRCPYRRDASAVSKHVHTDERSREGAPGGGPWPEASPAAPTLGFQPPEPR